MSVITRVWLARPEVGMAHAFGRVTGITMVKSVCGNVRREPGLPWELATGERARCFPCARAEQKAERASRETRRP